MIVKELGLPMGRCQCLHSKIPTENLIAKIGRAIRVCDGQTQNAERLYFAQGHHQDSSKEETRRPGTPAPRLLCHNALDL